MQPTLRDFEGTWRLTRQIEDKLDKMSGHLNGQAEFAPDSQGLIYIETGQLNLEGQSPMDASRRYLWQETETGILVSFEDGRPFHEFGLDRLMPDANHHCDPDLYHVSYDFTRWPQWSSTWRVIGPRKNYRMISRYSRSQ